MDIARMSDIDLELKSLAFIGLHCLIYLSTILVPNSYQTLTTGELIEKCINSSHGSSKAWDEFKARFDDHIQFLLYKTYSKFYKYNNSNEMNEALKDLKQDVYIRLLDNNCEGLKKFKGRSTNSLKAYLGVIAHNLALNSLDRYKKRFVCYETFENEIDPQSSPDADNSIFRDFEEQYLKESIMRILKKHYKSRKFSRDAVVFKLFYFENFTSKELAGKFELTASGIETLVARMKKVLVENYKREEG